MEPWTLLAAYAGVIVVLQVLVYLYYRRRSSQGERGRMAPSIADHDGTPGRQGAGPVSPDGDAPKEDDPDTVRCPHCGTPNEVDPVYTYCRNCGGELGH